jgi:hypothetical protein
MDALLAGLLAEVFPSAPHGIRFTRTGPVVVEDPDEELWTIKRIGWRTLKANQKAHQSRSY